MDKEEWHIDLFLEEATAGQAFKLFDDIVKMAADRGIVVSLLGIHPTSDCEAKGCGK